MKEPVAQKRNRVLRTWLISSTVAWVLGLLATLIFWRDLADGIVFLLMALGVLVLGIVLIATLSLVAAFRRDGVGGICSLVVMLGIVIYFNGGRGLGDQIRFSWARAAFETQLAGILKAHAAGLPIDPTQFPDLAHVDESSSFRVAFYWSRGVTDNWVGLVYDPTGEVMKANEFKSDWSNWKDSALQNVKMLFYGDLFRARHLSGHWYLCSFT